MEYRSLGVTGLKVSALSLGTWLTTGTRLDLVQTKELIRFALENGLNTFDTAEVYGFGAAELFLGEALRSVPRERLVVTTKIYWTDSHPNGEGHSRKRLLEGTKNSLRRLQMDYVDLLFCHRRDPSTTIEETVFAMNHLIEKGLTLYWGTSEWPQKDIVEAYTCAKKHSLHPPVVEQPEYNLFHRDRVEREYASLYTECGIGTTIWSPLASGILTGKYQNGIPEGSRYFVSKEWMPQDFSNRIKKTALFLQWAEKWNVSPASLAIAWCLKNSAVSTVILGATSRAQLADNLTSLSIYQKITPQEWETIEKVFV